MKVICIAGKAGSGKDTVGQMLSDAYRGAGYSVLVAHFADLVKYVCKTFFNWDGEKDEYGRGLLQMVGTDIVRAKDPNYWANFIRDVLTFFPELYDYVIIPDCRFPNELEVMRGDNLALLLRVTRPGHASTLTDEQKNHQSEVALDGILADIEFVNDASGLQELKSKIPELVKNIDEKFIDIFVDMVLSA